MGIALSSSWNAFRHNRGSKLLFEIKKLGFEDVELSFNLTARMVKDIEEMLKESGMRIVSLHNYCPIPDGLTRQEALPDCFSMASDDEKERKLAIKYTQRSIDAALKLGAKALVLHCGRVEIPDTTRDLMDLFNAGQKESAEFKELQNKTIQDRAAYAGPFFENTLRSLKEINRYARQQGVLLGVETRFYYREIPSFKEIGIILTEFKGANIFYWHDAGHAQVMDNLGLASHEEYLKSYGASAIGAHLHDVSGVKDHLPISYGEVDFARIKRHLNPKALKVIETHHPADGWQIKQSKAFIEKIFYGNR